MLIQVIQRRHFHTQQMHLHVSPWLEAPPPTADALYSNEDIALPFEGLERSENDLYFISAAVFLCRCKILKVSIFGCGIYLEKTKKAFRSATRSLCGLLLFKPACVGNAADK